MTGHPTTPRRGILIILSSPSGAGKTTLAHRLMAEFPGIAFSVSYTTRPPRPGEQDGRDYHFIGDAAFDRMIADDAFAEWAHVHGNRYGTSRAALEAALAEGRDMLFDIDWQGGAALAASWPDDALKVFILPPSLELLERRLRARATDADEVIRGRLARAVAELAHFRDYEHLIVNDDFDRAYEILRATYLVRAAGRAGSRDAELARAEAIVRANRDARPDKHAETLISTGSARNS